VRASRARLTGHSLTPTAARPKIWTARARRTGIDYLQRAVDAGYSTLWLTRDPDLESLHGDPDFEQIAARLEQ